LIYFIGIIVHGVYVSRKSGDGADDYFLAGRSLPWYLIGFSLFASNMSGSSFVGLMGGAYDNGFVIFNYEWTAALVLMLFAIFILPSYLWAKISTVPGFLEECYDVRSRRAFSLLTIFAILFIDTAGALYAGGLVISNVTGYLNLWTAVAVLAFVAGIYTILGGLSAVVVTDTVQAILLIVAAAVLFWTIVAGLVIGVPLFVVKEVLGLWTQWGQPEIHYTVMSSIMMALGIVLHLGISAMTRRKDKENLEDLVWSKEGAIQHFSTWEEPLWKNLTPWAGLLTVATIGFIIWFW
jgi:Na+/proline symporter